MELLFDGPLQTQLREGLFESSAMNLLLLLDTDQAVSLCPMAR
jgi:hypothetical protein